MSHFRKCDKAKQQQALAAIRLRSQIELDHRGPPSWIKGQIAPRNGEDPVQSALTTLEMIRDAFCAASNDGFAFTGHLEKEDRLGQTHVRIKQTYRGLDVPGAELTVHMTQDSVTIINGHFQPGIDLPTKPVLTSQEVSRIALEHVTAIGRIEQSVRAIDPS
jgi:Zn-dependent metalloprotease